MDKSPATRTSAAPPTEPRLFGDAERGDTRAKILDAAFRRLATEGYAALSVREIARDAGVNHALINYHFRTKDQLVIAVLDAANQRLLARQAAMYQAPSGFAQKWADARRFYESDLGSGFVRVQAELWAASLSNAELRDKFLPRLLAWKQLVLEAVREALAAGKAQGVELPRVLQRRSDRLLDLRVLARHGVRRSARREGRASRTTAPRSTPCSRCWSRSMRASSARAAQAPRARPLPLHASAHGAQGRRTQEESMMDPR